MTSPMAVTALLLSILAVARCEPPPTNASMPSPPLAPVNITWDPAPLADHWFEKRSGGRPGRPDCARAKRAIGLAGGYGRTNNMLREVAAAVELAATEPETTVLVKSASAKQIDDWFSWDGLKSWMCVAPSAPRGARVATYSMKDLFYGEAHGQTPPVRAATKCTKVLWKSPHDLGLILGQIVLRPVARVREEVDAFLDAHKLRGGYVAIHLRTLCLPRTNVDAQIRIKAADMPTKKAPTYLDMCRAEDPYIEAALEKDRVPRSWPLVVVSDRTPLMVKRAQEIQKKYRAVVSTLDVPGDMLLLAKSSYLFGNAASTFSWNAHHVRLANGASVTSSTLYMADAIGGDMCIDAEH